MSVPAIEIEEFKTLKNKSASSNGKLTLRFSSPTYLNNCKSLKSESVVKVASHARGFQVLSVINYVGRIEREDEKPIELEDENGCPLKGKEELEKVYKEWRNDFESGKHGLLRKPRHATHIVLSGDCENNLENQKKLLVAGREVARELLGDKGHRYLLGIHEDGGKAHVHIIVNNYHKEKGPKLRINNPELFEMRTLLAEKLTKFGLEHVATFRKDRPHIIERVASGLEDINNRQSRYIKTLEKTSPSFAVFQHKKIIARTIYNLRKSVNKDKTISNNERNELKSQLRELEVKLSKNEVNIKQEVTATFRHFEKQSEKLRLKAVALLDPDLNKKEKSSRIKSLAFHRKAFDNICEINKEAISLSNLSNDEKEARLELLQSHKAKIDDAFSGKNSKLVRSSQPSFPSTQSRIYYVLNRLSDRNIRFHNNDLYKRAGRSFEEHKKANTIILDRLYSKTSNINPLVLSEIKQVESKILLEDKIWKDLKDLHHFHRGYQKQWLNKKIGRANQKGTIQDHKELVDGKASGLLANIRQNVSVLGKPQEKKIKEIVERLTVSIDKKVSFVESLDSFEKEANKYFISNDDSLSSRLKTNERFIAKLETIKNKVTISSLDYNSKKAIYGEIYKTKYRVEGKRVKFEMAKIKAVLAPVEKKYRNYIAKESKSDSPNYISKTISNNVLVKQTVSDVNSLIRESLVPNWASGKIKNSVLFQHESWDS